MRPRSSLGHLARRLVGMLSRRPVPAADHAWVHRHLLDRERALWEQMSPADQRHSVAVGRRLVASAGPDTARDDVAAALLHDIGKLRSDLGPWGRVVATLVGPRTARLRRYHDHERIGAQMLIAAGSSERTVTLVDGSSPDRAAVDALRRADDV